MTRKGAKTLRPPDSETNYSLLEKKQKGESASGLVARATHRSGTAEDSHLFPRYLRRTMKGFSTPAESVENRGRLNPRTIVSLLRNYLTRYYRARASGQLWTAKRRTVRARRQLLNGENRRNVLREDIHRELYFVPLVHLLFLPNLGFEWQNIRLFPFIGKNGCLPSGLSESDRNGK